MEKLKVQIDREIWDRGSGIGLLVSNENCICFLGFVGLACGIPLEDIVRQSTPSSFYTTNTKWPASIVNNNNMTEFAWSLMKVNDCFGPEYNVTDQERENELIKLAAQANIDVEFVGSGCPDFKQVKEELGYI